MSRFYVGQRVKVVRYPDDGNSRGIVKVGDECTISGTANEPNEGFNPNRDRDLSVKHPSFDGPMMAPSYCFEPIIPTGHQVTSWDHCLWMPEHMRDRAAV